MSEVDLGPAPKEVDLGPAQPEQDLGPAPVDHAAMLQRISDTNPVGQVIDHLWSMGKGIASGEQPLGLSPDTQKELQDDGVFHNPDKQRYGDTLRMGAEALIRPAAKAFDLLGRSTDAVTGGLADSFGALYQATGAAQGDVEEFKRDTKGMMDMGLLVSGADGGPPPLSRVTLDANGLIHDEPIGSLPTNEDFKATSDALGKALPDALHDPKVVQGKVQSLYEQYGIHPAEVLSDAAKNPDIAKDLVSDSPMLPKYYTGIDPLQMAKDQIQASLKKTPTNYEVTLESRSAWPKSPDPSEANTRVSPMGFGDHLSDLSDRMSIGSVWRGIQMQSTPMAVWDSTVTARAGAKDFADMQRTITFDQQLAHDEMTAKFTPEQLKEMWVRSDEESVLKQRGESTDGKGLSTLPDDQAAAMRDWHTKLNDLFEGPAKAEGVVPKDAKGLPAYTPRMSDTALRRATGDFAKPLDPIGQNLRTTSANLLHRKYETVEQTEEAMRKINSDASVVRDARVYPIVEARLRQAIAGKKLINDIEKVGKSDAIPTVIHGEVPAGWKSRFFTIENHPSFYGWKPMLRKGEGGRFERVKDEEGQPLSERKPISVRRDFEGPLRSVLNTPDPDWYRGAMAIKSKSMHGLMWSPLMHNQVIWGRLLPESIQAKSLSTFKFYFDGYKARTMQPDEMRMLIGNGLNPFAKRGFNSDITSVTNGNHLLAGNSITSQVAEAFGDLFSKGEAFKKGIDSAGHFWHQTLLWDRVADAQVGLALHIKDNLLDKGVDQLTAYRAASHLANRFTGSMPTEALSKSMRGFTNIALFSRSYTLSMLGTFKDALVGLPRDLQGQILRDSGTQMLDKVQSFTRRKAIAYIAMDVGLNYAINALAQSGYKAFREKQQDTEDHPVTQQEQTWNEWGSDYMGRLEHMLGKEATNPANIYRPLAIAQNILSSPSSNEPGKEDRVLTGYADDGTAQYVKIPAGKTGAELQGYLSHPAQMMLNKLSPLVKGMGESIANKDYAGRYIYNPYPETPEEHIVATSKFVWHIMEGMVPGADLKAAYNLFAGGQSPDEAKADGAHLFGGLTGFMYSQGYPGGPVGGFVSRQKEIDKYNYDMVAPELRKAIKEGRDDDANGMMKDLRFTPRQMSAYKDMVLNPSNAFAKRRFQSYLQGLPEDQRELYQHILDMGKEQ